MLSVNVGTGAPLAPARDQGLSFDANGAIYATITTPPSQFYYGLPFDADGRLVIENAPITYYSQGIPFTANNAVAVTDTPGNGFNQGTPIGSGGAIFVDGLQPPPTPPEQVTNLVLTIPVDNQIHAVWDAPASDPPIDTYLLQYKASASPTWIEVDVGNVTSYDITGLVSGTQYDVRVRAQNAVGDGPQSTIAQITVEGVPAAIALGATAGIELANLTWTNPTPAPALSALEIQYKLSANSTWLNFPRAGLLANQTIYNLYQGGSQYDFRVRSANAKGNSAWSNTAQVTPTLISINKELELNELGVLDSPVRVTNSGTAGASRDFLNQAGAGTALSVQIHKNKYCWQSIGARALLTGGSQTRIAQPATFFWAGIPFYVDNVNQRAIWSSPGDNPESYAQDTQTSLYAGTQADGPPIDLNNEWIIVWRLNGANSSVRCIKNDGLTDNITTNLNPGAANPSPFVLCWDSALTPNRDFPAQVYEFNWFTGNLSAAEEDSRINAIKQKWFLGVDGE